MTEQQRKDFHEHAWKHFTIHAQQRMTSFQFFIGLCTVIIGGIVVLLKDPASRTIVAPLAFALPLFALIFWKLDDRSRQLIRVSEDALRHLENNDSGVEDVGGKPHVLKIMSTEAAATAESRKKKALGFIPTHFSYATCFRLVFFLFGLAGLVIGIIALIIR